MIKIILFTVMMLFVYSREQIFHKDQEQTFHENEGHIFYKNKHQAKHFCHDKKQLSMPTFHVREELGLILKNLNFTVGVELGVKEGEFAFDTLKE
jgi:hypothetical protein